MLKVAVHQWCRISHQRVWIDCEVVLCGALCRLYLTLLGTVRIRVNADVIKAQTASASRTVIEIRYF